MELKEAILKRRSIRKYTPQPISKEMLKELVTAGMYAPTARNTQSWQFLVVTQRETLDRIMDAHPYAKMLKYAQAAILVCGDLKLEENPGYLNTNCSAATQNILLAAHGMGLGAVWLGVYPREERMEALRKVLELPAHILPIALVSLGYPDEEKPVPERYDGSKIHWEKW
jgi:nitroreductase